MFLRLTKFCCLLFWSAHLLHATESMSGANVSPNLKTILQEIVPLRTDGKIEIPSHIKHIKLDIGLSFYAPMSQYWLTHEDDLLVFGFEPNPDCVTSILQGATTWIDSLETKFIGKNFFLVPCALGLSNSKTIKFYITPNYACSSLYFPKDFPIKQVIDVPIFSLSDFFDLFPFDSHSVIDYIKIDAQGADLDIIKSAGNYLEKSVVYITLEAENSQYENTINSEQDIDNYMKSIGFVKFKSLDTIDPTYFNPRYSEYVKNHDIKIYQKG